MDHVVLYDMEGATLTLEDRSSAGRTNEACSAYNRLLTLFIAYIRPC